MFSDLIYKPIDPIPEQYFTNLKKPTSEPDYSLSCLGVALFKNRVEGYSGITGKYYFYSTEYECVSDFVNMYGSIDTYPMFCYYMYSTPDAISQERLEKLGFKIKESIGKLIETKSGKKCIAAYHETKACCAIFINSRDVRFYHLLISFLSLLFPTLFADKPLTDTDYNIIKALSKTDKNIFVHQIREALAPYSVEFIKITLSNLIADLHEKKISEAQDKIYGEREVIKGIERQYMDALATLRELITSYEGMKITEKFDEVEEELIDYLSTNKNVRNMTVLRNRLNFVVPTLLNNYSAETWEIFSQRGYIYDGNYGRGLLDIFRDRNKRKLLLDNIFSESPEFAIKIIGNYQLDISSCFVRTNSTYDYEEVDSEYKSYLPNPHLKLFSCLGGYERRIPGILQDRNYIGAIELCIASAGSVDLDETEQTFRPFLGWLLSSREKVLRRKDGVDMTPEEAVLYLIDKEKTDETDSNG